jgi:hypothetical protein
MKIGEHESLRRKNRQRAQDPAVHEIYRRKRPLVEHSLAWLVRGNRRVPYRGVTKNNAGSTTASPDSTCAGSSPWA